MNMAGTGAMSPPMLLKYVKIIMIGAFVTLGLAPFYHEHFRTPIALFFPWYWIMAIFCLAAFWILRENYRL